MMSSVCCKHFVRTFSTTQCVMKKPNIQKPRVPGTERRILDAVSVPIFPQDPRPLPIQCYENLKQKEEAKRSDLTEAYEAFRLRETKKMFTENQMVAICHKLPTTSRDFFAIRTKVYTSGIHLKFARNDWARSAVENSRLQNLTPYLTSDNVYLVSEENKVAQLIPLLRKIPELQLLGGLVEDRILSREQMMNIAKLPPLDTLRGELLTILSTSASKTSRLLGRHQQDLATSLSQLVKQGSESGEGEMTQESVS